MNFYNKQMKSMMTAAGLVLLTGVAGFSGSVMASTPDGETPANEGICDILQGGSPGLYGLCVAYCEAQDLDIIDKEPPRTKILENYNKKKQAGDPDMPCVHTPCPCWTDAELASIGEDGMAAACLRGADTTQLIDNGTTHFAFADIDRNRCSYVDLDPVPPTVNFQNISAEDAQACLNAVNTECDSLGF